MSSKLSYIIEQNLEDLRNHPAVEEAIHDADPDVDMGTLVVKFRQRECRPIELNLHIDPTDGLLEINLVDPCGCEEITRLEMPSRSVVALKLWRGDVKTETYLYNTDDITRGSTTSVTVRNPEELRIEYLRKTMYIHVR